jgi:hypothetical protein
MHRISGKAAAACAAVLLALAAPSLAAAGSAQTSSAQTIDPQEAIVSIERIWDRAGHSAFTDLAAFEGRIYCAFREGSGHVHGINGTVRIIVSEDRQNWRSIALLAEEAVDLRDPKLSVTPDGRIMVTIGGSYYQEKQFLKREPRVSFSDEEGENFSAPAPIEIEEEIRTEHDWLWRVTWHEGVGYGVVYQAAPEDWKIHLVSTEDGVRYQPVTPLDLTGRPNETTLRFLTGGKMVALVRREGDDRSGVIGTSAPPYTEWNWASIGRRLGGPNLIVLPDGGLLAGTRGGHEDKKYTTELLRIEPDGSAATALTLPSGGDTSYPGFVLENDRLLVSYYSSHEGRAAIYLAALRVEPFLRRDAGKSEGR